MLKYKLVIDSEHSKKWHGIEFGPFTSIPHAKHIFEKGGWFYQPRRVWTAQISRYTGIEGRLKMIKSRSKKLTPIEDIPQGVAGYWGD